jgi:hypothetical protein
MNGGVQTEKCWNRVEFTVLVDVDWQTLSRTREMLDEAEAALVAAGADPKTLELRVESEWDYGSTRIFSYVKGHRPLTRAEKDANKRKEKAQKDARAAFLREELARLEA